MKPVRLHILLILMLSPTLGWAQTAVRNDELDAVIKELSTKGYDAVKNKKLNLRTIHYITGTSRLTLDDKHYLDTVTLFLARVPTVIMEIGGHTDNIGGRARNKQLSHERASSVMQYMLEQGVLAKRIRAVGYGSDQPLADNRTEQGRALNRRVEMKFLGLTNDVYTLTTKSGRKLPATYLVISPDGRTISYRENANAPLTRIPASGIDYIEYPDGSRRRPDAIVINDLRGETVLKQQEVSNSEPVKPPIDDGAKTRSVGKWLGGKFPRIRRWTVVANGGIAPFSVRQANIDFSYVDESPSRDKLTSAIQLDKRQFAGVGQIGFEWETSTNWLAHVQYGFGIASGAGFSGIILGAGKTFGKRNQWATCLDLTLGNAYLKLGELVQNSVYIQVNGTRFDSKTVPIRFRNYYAAFTPQLSYSFLLNDAMSLRLTAGYSYSFHTRSILEFSGKNAEEKSVHDTEKLSAENVSFKLDGNRVTDARLFDVRGGYATIGFLYHLYHRN